MRFCLMFAVLFFAPLACGQESGEVNAVVISGDWGRLECIPATGPAILPGNKTKNLLGLPVPPGNPNDPLSRQMTLTELPFRTICDFRVIDSNGDELKPLDDKFNYLVSGKVQQITMRSSNPKSVFVIAPDNCTIRDAGKSKITVRFAGKSCEFMIEVIRSKVCEGMSPVEVIKAIGKPSLRLKKDFSSTRPIAGTAVLKTDVDRKDVWRWERQPNLEVVFGFGLKGDCVERVHAAPFPGNDEIEKLKSDGLLIEDLRPGSKAIRSKEKQLSTQEN